MEQRGISKLDLKRQNRLQILRVVHENGTISRVDIASQLQLTRAAVTIITNEMISEGVLQELGEAPIELDSSRKADERFSSASTPPTSSHWAQPSPRAMSAWVCPPWMQRCWTRL